MRRALLAALTVLGLVPAAAHGQGFTPPTLTPDLAFAPPTGIARGDFLAGTITDIPAAVAVDGDRIYTVGRTQGGTGGADIGITARRSDGAFDGGFSDDGKLIISIAPSTESDIGTGIVVLPDHRLRIVASTDVIPGSSESLDVAIVGLNADGSPDPTFGGPGTSTVVFPAGPANDVPSRILSGADGRLGIVGSRSNGSRDDLFVSLREADGSPVSGFGIDGVRVLDRGGTVNGVSMVDRGIDVEFRNGGLLALALVETNPSSAFDYVAVLHAFDATGADDPTFSDDGDLVLPVGEPDTVPGGLVAYGDRFYVTGYTHAGADTNAFLARVDANGGAFETRAFDMRGRVVPAGQPVVSRALDLALVPGLPPTLVAAGSVDWVGDSGSTNTDWAAAAFNRFDGPLADAGFGDTVLQAPGQGGLISVAAGSGWAAVGGTYIDSSTADNSYGNARLLIDVEKRCDLSLTVAEPAEIVFRGTDIAALTATIKNQGTRACSGTLSVSAPYRLGAYTTGVVEPNASVTARAIPLARRGARRAEDFMQATLTAAGDVDTSNNGALVHLVFRYCDLGVRPAGSAGLVPNEGTRSFPVTLRNAGSTACRVRSGAGDSFALEAGKSAADRIAAAAPAGARVGAVTNVMLRAVADSDVEPANNTAAVAATVVGVGDSDVRRWSARGFSGRAVGGRGSKKLSASVRLDRVDVALLRERSGRCEWLASAAGTFSSRKRTKGGDCGTPRWLRASGRTAWRMALRRALTSGRYTVYSRAVIAAGYPEARFSRADRNRILVRIR